MRNKSLGFTLVELMISLILGLIIIAAGVQLLISGQKSLLFQSAVADVQDNANIGINYIAADLHHANLNLPNRKMVNNAVSGLVIKAGNYPDYVKSGQVYSESASGLSFTDKKSDVLVIQYRPVDAKGYDCEGNIINSTNVIVQRYFLRKDANSANGDLALACDAGQYISGTGNKINGLDGSGQIIMPRVDQFRVLIGVIDTASNTMAYLTPEQFKDSSSVVRAVSVQIGLIVRSADNSGSNTIEPTEIQLFNEKNVLTPPKTVAGRYMRIPVEQTIAFRNAIGDDT
ncbi:PilW family protein [Acinetobacter sp.]|uniref:PilW family protein n=1 Tax=Acinetobacter sp. TaxID=472 RepID=UPI002584F133|nr:PilW family protein [Acinetobacter sp.]